MIGKEPSNRSKMTVCSDIDLEFNHPCKKKCTSSVTVTYKCVMRKNVSDINLDQNEILLHKKKC